MYIGKECIDNCTNLLSLTVPSSVDYIGSIQAVLPWLLNLKEGNKNLELGTLSDNKINSIWEEMFRLNWIGCLSWRI